MHNLSQPEQNPPVTSLPTKEVEECWKTTTCEVTNSQVTAGKKLVLPGTPEVSPTFLVWRGDSWKVGDQ